MAALAFGGMRRYAAVPLYPLVVVRQAAEGGEYYHLVWATKLLLAAIRDNNFFYKFLK
jgi:hypothetical protein